MKQVRIIYIDYLKTIAILMVVFYHCGFGDIFVKTLYSVCCPIFFAVNGFLMFKKERTTQHIIRKNYKILLLMIFWSVFLTAMMMFIRDNYNIYDFAKNIFYLGQGYCNHLWFIGALFVLNIFYLLLYDFIHKSQSNYFLMLGLTILCCLDLPKYLTWQMNPFIGWFYRFSICYFILGYGLLYYKLFDKIPVSLLMIMSIFVFIIKVHQNSGLNYDITFAGYDSFWIMILTSGIILICKKIYLPQMGIIEFCSKNSLSIYLLHIVILLPIQHYFPMIRDWSFWLGIGVFFSTCMMTFLFKKNRFTSYLITI